MTKATPKDVAKAIRVMQETIPFFPETPLAIEVIQRSIERFNSTQDELFSLVQVACDTMERWSLPGFRALRAAASEQAYYERENRENARKLQEWKEEAKLLGSGDSEPFLIPSDAIKRVPESVPPTPPTPKPVKPIPTLREAEADLEKQLAESKRRSPEETAMLLAELELKLGVKKLQ